MKDFPARKPHRLKDYDYSQDGAYFITICVKDRCGLLCKIVGSDALGAPFVELSEYGEFVNKEIEETSSHYVGVEIDKFTVIPNHVHMIMMVGKDGAPRASRPTTALIPTIVTALKKKTIKAFSFNFWQTSYHDHIIRDEPYDELLKDADVMDHCFYNADFPVAEWEVARYERLLKEFGINRT